MRHELELGYLGIEVPDPASLTSFFGDVIGLVPGEPAEGPAATWRNDDRAHRIIVQPGPSNDAVFIGFETTSAAAFDVIIDRLQAAGFEVTDGTDEDRRSRRVERLARVSAPWGIPVEIVAGLEQATTPYSSQLVPGGFHTGGVGFGHAVFATTAFDEAHRFSIEGLGLDQSDWLEMEIAAGIELEVRFYHCNERHHTVALARAPFELPQKLHHIMFETNSRDDVGAAFDRAWATISTSPTGSAVTTTTACSASTWPARPGSKSRSATAHGSSPTTGTTTAATTTSAPGATSPCASTDRGTR
jgi:biphenyl-2,3-diol 1,2-dioxygenase